MALQTEAAIWKERRGRENALSSFFPPLCLVRRTTWGKGRENPAKEIPSPFHSCCLLKRAGKERDGMPAISAEGERAPTCNANAADFRKSVKVPFVFPPFALTRMGPCKRGAADIPIYTRAGNKTVSSRKTSRRDEMRPSRSRLVS